MTLLAPKRSEKGWHQHGAFEAAGNRLTHADAKGVVSTSTYDALDRLTSTSYTDSTLNVAFHYDESNTVTGCAVSGPMGRRSPSFK